ncbi:response regulator [Conexibacter stalactiti]|uniref:Response regulator n=1 Tax=Conexibacter stalactiti TaxID=1940611 RepID=A0ABU4HQS5_9ACTN|nr:response regulator [Conexibacter stalactiti]MDW5595584.1 response regulator [Conexibacter stalactiti]MEC5036226.1 response regulator [Conexibacter stalactiti]
MTESVVPEELAELWEELRPAVLVQVAAVRAAVAALHAGPLPAEAREQARTDAHQLAGSLGSFGFDAAGRAARTLELRFKAGPASEEAPELDALVRELAEQLDPLPTPQPAAPREPATHEAPGPSRVDVALVEDDEVLAALALHALGARGWTTRWIADGERALRELGGARPALRPRLLLVDWELPSRNGPELLRALASDGSLTDVAIVMTTGHGGEEAVAEARALGAAHLAKPYTVARLVETVRARLAP